MSGVVSTPDEVWVAFAAEGLARYERAAGAWQLFGVEDGLVSPSVGAVAVTETGEVFATSGIGAPPVLQRLERGAWAGLPHPNWFTWRGRTRPGDGTGTALAASADTVLIAGSARDQLDSEGKEGFFVAWDRRADAWSDLQVQLRPHVESIGLEDVLRSHGINAFQAKSLHRLPGGGFVAVHGLGVTLLTPFGTIERTVPYGGGRFVDEPLNQASACLSPGGGRIFVVGRFVGGNCGPEWGDGAGMSCVVELDLNPSAAGPPRFLDVSQNKFDQPASIGLDGGFVYVDGNNINHPFPLRRYALVDGSLPAD